MTDNKKHSFKAPLAAILAALIGATALLAGCGGSGGNEESSENETRVVTETQVVTRVVDGVYTDENGNPIKDENGQPMTAPSGTPDTDTGDGSANNGGSSADNSASNNGGNGGSASNSSSASSSAGENAADNNGGNSGSSAAQSDDKSSSSKADDKGSSEKKGSGTLSVGGKTYNVGDKVICTYTLTSKKLLSNFQAQVKYDNKYLKPTNAYLDGPAKAGSVINYELYEKGLIKFNGINLNGYNYTKGDKFLVVEYEVLDGGSTAPEFIWEIASDTKDNALITNHKADSSFSLSASFS